MLAPGFPRSRWSLGRENGWADCIRFNSIRLLSSVSLAHESGGGWAVGWKATRRALALRAHPYTLSASSGACLAARGCGVRPLGRGSDDGSETPGQRGLTPPDPAHCAEAANLAPDRRHDRVELAHGEIAGAEVDDPRSVGSGHGSMDEIRILRDDRQVVLGGMPPDVRVGPRRAEVVGESVTGSGPRLEPPWQIGVDQVAGPHTTAWML